MDRRFAILAALGAAYAGGSQNSRAEKLLREAIELHAQSKLAVDRNLGLSLNDLGLILADRGVRDEAILLHSRAADIFRKHGDANDLATALANLAGLRLEERDLQKADAALEEVADIASKSGLDATTAGHLHRVRTFRYFLGGNTSQAVDELKVALDSYQTILPPTHPTVVDTKKCYAFLLRKTGHKKEAKALEAEIAASVGVDNSAEQVRTNTIDYRALLKQGK
jgi:tetratricopeptide (TPR) repeat protein